MATPDNPIPNLTGGLHPGGAPLEELQGGYRPNTEELLKQGHAATAHKLAKWLLIILGGTVLVHIACIMVLVFCKLDEGIKVLEDVFHAWLPVLAGLAGSAVTYYFTKDSK